MISKILTVFLLFSRMSQATIKPLRMANPYYSKEGVDVTIRWEYVGDDKDVAIRKWQFRNTSNILTVFQTIAQKFPDADPITTQTSPIKNVQFQNNATLIIKNPVWYQSGEYRFEITYKNGDPESQSEIEVIITAKPTASISCASSVDVNQEERFECDCDCKNGHPSPNSTWFKKGKEIVTGNLKAILLIENVKRDDAGTYKCVCKSHDLTVDEKELKINVRYPPENMVFPKNSEKIAYEEMSTFTLTCKAEGYPEPTYEIYNGTSKLKTHCGAFISDRPATSEDEGEYKCIAMNVVGNLNGTFTLQVQDKKEFSEKSNDGTKTYVIVLAFFGGTIFGMLLLYIILLVVRRLRKRGNRESSSCNATSSQHYDNVTASENVPTYQELDVTKMNNEDSKYQSLQGNTRDPREKNEEKENEGGYAELNKVRGNEESNYQSLNRV